MDSKDKSQAVVMGQFYDLIEKIVSAIIRVTDLLDENDPLRIGCRQKCVEVLNLSLSLSWEGLKGQDSIKDIKDMLRTLMAYTTVLQNADYISRTGADLLRSKITESFKAVENSFDPTRSLHSFDLSFLQSIMSASTHMAPLTDTRRVDAVGPSSAIPRNSVPTDTSNMSRAVPTDLSNSTRRTQILEIVKSRGEASIGDIAKVIKDCSEKTIQRELVALVGLGALRREGARRWSRYMIV